MNFKYTKLTTEKEVLDLIRYHNDNSKYVFLDIETSGLDPFNDHITDIVLNGYEKFEGVIFPYTYVQALKILERPVVAHNFKFDFNFLFRAGIDLRTTGLHADTMLLDHLLDENQEHSLDAIVKRRYNDNYKEVFWNTYKEYTLAPEDKQIEYACKDIIYTEMVFEDLSYDLDLAGIPQSLIHHVHRLALTLYDTEINGIKLDLDYLNKMSTTLQTKMSTNMVEMRNLVELEISLIENDDFMTKLATLKTDKGKANVKRPEFNFDSSKQLGVLLYDILGLPQQLSNARKRTVDDHALSNLEAKHPIVSKLREHRGIQKVHTSFIEGSLKKMHGGRIHPSFNINGTVTGRISSSGPNMQQLPKDGGVRGIYVPDEGRNFLSCDYGQLEVSLAAHFSRDENLLKIVYEGASQHDITAAGLGIDRNKAKTINFAMQYGAGIKKVQTILGCSPKDAEYALNKYWETYAGLHRFIKQCHKAVDDGIPLVNPFGRQRHFPTVFEDKWAREAAYRQAANSVIQGTGSDLTSWSVYTINDKLKELGYGKVMFSLHDEILSEILDTYVEQAKEIITTTMIESGTRMNLTVPLTVSMSKGMKRWQKS